VIMTLLKDFHDVLREKGVDSGHSWVKWY